MVDAVAEIGPGEFRLTVSGHETDDPAACSAVTAVEQTVMIMFEQLAALRPDEISFEIKALEATP